ncbi:reactivating factor for ethanolamine ammonia lyase [compost metagenome]
MASAMERAFAEGKRRFTAGGADELRFAVAIPAFAPVTYPVIKQIASAAAEAAHRYGMAMLILIFGNDIAKAAGNIIHLVSRGEQACICLDQIAVGQGDYIDIGVPLGGGCIPVAVKTLIFRP